MWELGKYSVVAVLLVALVRMRPRRNRVVALLYLGLLLPSALLTFTAQDLGIARQLLSFNLSGPLSLTLCVLFCSNTRLLEIDIRPMFLTMLGPLAGIATLGVRSLATHSNVEFVNASNYIAAGEFGANQVSAALGLGVLLALLVILDRRTSNVLRIPLGVIALAFAVQSAITFSRSGLALAFASMLAAAFYMVRDRRVRITLVLVSTVVFAIGKYVVVPRLDDFTNGKFGERYSEFESDGRTKLASYDWAVFADHPLMGVGPGMANVLRQEMGHSGAAHTEYTRLLAEHGILGSRRDPGARADRVARVPGLARAKYQGIVAGLLVWAALFLAVSGMRLVAPSVVLGLACSIAYSFTPPRRPSPHETEHEPGLLYVGNFLSAAGFTRGYGEDLAGSPRAAWLARRADIAPAGAHRAPCRHAAAAFVHRADYDLAHVDVFSGPSFVWAEAVCAELKVLGEALHPDAPRWEPAGVRAALAATCAPVARGAAMVTAPSRYLCDAMSPYRADIVMQPNALDLSSYPFTARPRVRPKLIWVSRDARDLQPVARRRGPREAREPRPRRHADDVGPDKDGSLTRVQARAPRSAWRRASRRRAGCARRRRRTARARRCVPEHRECRQHAAVAARGDGARAVRGQHVRRWDPLSHSGWTRRPAGATARP